MHGWVVTYLAYDVDQTARYNNDALDGSPIKMTRYGLVCGGSGLDSLFVGIMRDLYMAPYTAVDLQGELNLVSDKGRSEERRVGKEGTPKRGAAPDRAAQA